MDNKQILEKIRKAAKEDERKRKDIRHRRAMAFLIKKGFLKANTDFEKYYHARVNLKDFIWAGKNVEPRILEVLPAAIARLPKAFMNVNKNMDLDLLKVVDDLNHQREDGTDYLNIRYEKIKVWMDLPLADHRTKIQAEKKITKTFRLNPAAINKLEEIRIQKGFKSETAALEYLISG